MNFEWTRIGPMGCLIKPEAIPKDRCLIERTPTCVSNVLAGQPPPNVTLE